MILSFVFSLCMSISYSLATVPTYLFLICLLVNLLFSKHIALRFLVRRYQCDSTIFFLYFILLFLVFFEARMLKVFLQNETTKWLLQDRRFCHFVLTLCLVFTCLPLNVPPLCWAPQVVSGVRRFRCDPHLLLAPAEGGVSLQGLSALQQARLSAAAAT